MLVPVRDDLGEPLDVALQPQSQFRSILSSFNPNEATVTVWVYPDSFDQFRATQRRTLPARFLHRQPPHARRAADQRFTQWHTLGRPVVVRWMRWMRLLQ